ncbi:UNVERIFIED_CONTAM: hypothetical protein GTU68_042103 [Idotea baltica]|nr:hypothetical protein [Idotea baltica]
MGKALLVAGSYGKMGACVLAAKACKRSGVGLLIVHSPKCGYTILQSTVPEAMALVDKSDAIFTEGLDTSSYDVIAVGPGLGTKKSTRKALTFLIKQTEKPMVLDADALNILAAQPELFKHLPNNSIITPHRGEWERICGIPTSESLAQLQAARKFAKTYKITIVLKDAITAIIDVKGNVYFNATGNSGLATGGSGDVLTGIITALMAQNYTTLEATKLGVYIHGKAADIAIKETQSPESLIASDVVEYLGKAFGSLLIDFNN